MTRSMTDITRGRRGNSQIILSDHTCRWFSCRWSGETEWRSAACSLAYMLSINHTWNKTGNSRVQTVKHQLVALKTADVGLFSLLGVLSQSKTKFSFPTQGCQSVLNVFCRGPSHNTMYTHREPPFCVCFKIAYSTDKLEHLKKYKSIHITYRF